MTFSAILLVSSRAGVEGSVWAGRLDDRAKAEVRKVRPMTVELIVEEKPWESGQAMAPGDPPDLVLVRVNWLEDELRRGAKHPGGRSDPKARVRRLTRAAAKLLNLTARIIECPLPVMTRDQSRIDEREEETHQQIE